MRFLIIICGLLAVSGTTISTSVPDDLRLSAEKVLRLDLTDTKRNEITTLIKRIQKGEDFPESQRDLEKVLEPFLKRLTEKEKFEKEKLSRDRELALIEWERVILEMRGYRKMKNEVREVVTTYINEGSRKPTESAAYDKALRDIEAIQTRHGFGMGIFQKFKRMIR